MTSFLNRLRALAETQAVVALVGLALLEAIFAFLHRLGDLKLYVVETIAAGLAAGLLYFILLFALEHLRESRATLWVVLAGALLFRLTLVSLVPTLSTDIFRYRWEGRVQAAGWNPYLVRPDDPRLIPLRDAGWRLMPGPEVPAMYPPLTELVNRLTWRVLPGPVGFKLPFLMADLLVVAILAGWLRATGGRAFQLAIYAWNPLVIVEFAASGHNDALALAGLLAAIVIIRRELNVSTTAARASASSAFLAAGAMTKAFPAVLIPLWLRRAGWPRSRNGWIALGAGSALTAACIWPYRSAWPGILDVMAYYQSRWQNYNASLYALLAWFSGSPDLAWGAGIGVVAGLALRAAARRMDLARAAYLLTGATLLFAPNGYSWYFTWIVPFICFFPRSRAASAWLLLTILQFLSYNVLIDFQARGRWHFDPFYQWLTYAPFYALLLLQLLRARGPGLPAVEATNA